MVQAGQHLRLAVEALGLPGGLRQVGVHQLERHLAPQRHLLGPPDGAHPALPELLDDAEAAGVEGPDHSATSNTAVVAARPLTLLSPRLRSCQPSGRRARVASLIRICPGWAIASRRAATFTASPITV